MSEVLYKFDTRVAVIDQYRLPPIMIIKECPIVWTLAQATSKKHAKYLAAQITMGQPFF